MLVLLPPSETKAPGGRGAPLHPDRLSFPALNPVRARILDALHELSGDLPLARKVLKISARQDGELADNRAIRAAPTVPALRRYTGVLYDALGYASLDRTARGRADRTLVVGSALFGALRPRDPIPTYRLSGGTNLPGVGPLANAWRPVLVQQLTGHGLVLDLRSSAYQALAPVPDAVTVRVLSPLPDGTLGVVSHHNKSHKGQLVRALLTAPRMPRSLDGVLAAASAAGLPLSVQDERHLDLVV